MEPAVADIGRFRCLRLRCSDRVQPGEHVAGVSTETRFGRMPWR